LTNSPLALHDPLQPAAEPADMVAEHCVMLAMTRESSPMRTWKRPRRGDVADLTAVIAEVRHRVPVAGCRSQATLTLLYG
jgi:hypothetical protein